MATITSVVFWKDTGFTEGCPEIPSVNNSLPSPYIEYGTGFRPSKLDFFNKIKVPDDYVALMDVSYIKVVYSSSNSIPTTIYGWVDEVAIVSDNPDNPVTEVSWHIDYWRTYSSRAVLSSGTIVRRKRETGSVYPHQNVYSRYMRLTSSDNLLPAAPTDYWWAVINFVHKTTNAQGGVITYNKTACFPFNTNSPSARVPVGPNTAPSFSSLIAGTWDEMMEIDPDTIVSAYMLPCPPSSLSSSGALNGWEVVGVSASACSYYIASGGLTMYPYTYVKDLGDRPADEYNKRVITGFTGEIMGVVPQGFNANTIALTPVISFTSGYLSFRVAGGSSAEGLVFNTPALTLEVGTNGWSSYMYSGQREYDMRSRDFASKAAAIEGVTASIGSVGSAAMTGALVGAVGGPIGALAGGIIGGAASLIGTAINFGNDMSWKNREMQRLEDFNKSCQSENLIMPGSGFYHIVFGNGVKLRTLKPDQASEDTARANELFFGVECCQSFTSPFPITNYTGPLKMSNLSVKGAIPPKAKEYIRNMFEKGVRLT